MEIYHYKGIDMKRILIANRGEVALDIINTLKSLDVESVLICSEDDRDLITVDIADKVIFTNKNAQVFSDIETILEYAIKYECDAIHPGYGFLANNPDFIENCEKKGIKFIGPPGNQVKQCYSKIRSQIWVESLGLKVVKHSDILTNVEGIEKVASEIGYPLLVIPDKSYLNYGIHYVENEKRLKEKFLLSQKEAFSLLKNQEVFLEYFYKNAHTVEVPFAKDKSGFYYIFDIMSTSGQYKSKKVILEVPAPFLSVNLKEKIKEISNTIVKNLDFFGIGSLEFVITDKKEILFTNINPFLPIGYMIYKKMYNIDFISMQIDIVMGNKLDINERRVFKHGLELRIFSENWLRDFQPEPGEIKEIFAPFNSTFYNSDFITPLKKGTILSPYYIPYLGKLICCDNSRIKMINNALISLETLKIRGTINTKNFVRNLIGSKYFREGKLTQDFIDHMLKNKIFRNYIENSKLAACIAACIIHDKRATIEKRIISEKRSLWGKIGRLSLISSRKL